ncbi:MAG TPA: YggS family pyridoxal phosphate-dependent enzyme [Treponemataceae bacterium]|nr:YggS family pyridoxal phosphate-dependent enzyme [Treponemataceae bacterium]
MGIKANLERIRDSIHTKEHELALPHGSVNLVAISKFHSQTEVQEAILAGQSIFGENRVQEATEKFIPLIAEYPQITVHLVGNLQSNKISRIVPVASCIQSIDRLDLLKPLNRHAQENNKRVEVLFEYHTAEDSKAGFMDDDSVFRAIESCSELEHIIPMGFMTMAPFTDDKNSIRDSFRKTRKLREACLQRFPQYSFPVLSMGMSGDYEIAIEEGSTMVRIGTAIFGERTQ